MTGLMLSDDLIFSSRVTGTARAVGRTVTVVKTVEDLLAKAKEVPPAAVILDLNLPGLKLVPLLADLRAGLAEMPRVVGYGSHVDAAGLKAARAAGCDLVMPRSVFVEKLESDLAAWLT